MINSIKQMRKSERDGPCKGSMKSFWGGYIAIRSSKEDQLDSNYITNTSPLTWLLHKPGDMGTIVSAFYREEN